MEKTSTLKQIIDNIDLTKDVGNVSLYGIAGDIFDFYGDFIETQEREDELNRRLKRYYVMTWHCSDRFVGTTAYFLDDKFAYLEQRQYGNDDADYTFASDEMFQEVKAFVKTFIPEKKDLYTIVNFDDELAEMYFVSDASSIIHNYAFKYDGTIVDILNKNLQVSGDLIGGCSIEDWHKVEVRNPDGTTEIMDCRDLSFKYSSPFTREEYEKSTKN